MTKHNSQLKEQSKKRIILDFKTWIVLTFSLVVLSLLIKEVVFWIMSTLSFVIMVVNYLHNKQFPQDVEIRTEIRKSEKRMKDKMARDNKKLFEKLDYSTKKTPQLLANTIGKVRGDMDRILQATGWEVITNTEKEILVDFGTFQFNSRNLEIFAE